MLLAFCYTVAENLAISRTALQSTTYAGTSASFADDGDMATASCTATSDQPWWAVELATTTNVMSVVITSNNITDHGMS